MIKVPVRMRPQEVLADMSRSKQTDLRSTCIVYMCVCVCVCVDHPPLTPHDTPLPRGSVDWHLEIVQRVLSKGDCVTLRV